MPNMMFVEGDDARAPGPGIECRYLSETDKKALDCNATQGK